MDRSEDEKPKDCEADLFQVRDGGKPRVAQPPQREKEARRAGAQGRQTPKRMGRAQGRPEAGPGLPGVGGVVDPPARPKRSVTRISPQGERRRGGETLRGF